MQGRTGCWLPEVEQTDPVCRHCWDARMSGDVKTRLCVLTCGNETISSVNTC